MAKAASTNKQREDKARAGGRVGEVGGDGGSPNSNRGSITVKVASTNKQREDKARAGGVCV